MDTSKVILEVLYGEPSKVRRLYCNYTDIDSYVKLEWYIRNRIESLKFVDELGFRYKEGDYYITLSNQDEELVHVISNAPVKDKVYKYLRLSVYEGKSPQVCIFLSYI